MKTLLLRDGDLAVSRRDYLTVTGTGKVMQDIRGALLEPLGNDRFHPGWGSTLEDYVGDIVDPETVGSINGEVNRVITNYAAIQRDKIEADISNDSDTRFTTDEVLNRVTGVSVVGIGDMVNIEIGLETVSGETVVLTESVA